MSIQIDVIADKVNGSKTCFSGMVKEVIPDEEISTWGLSTETIKNAIKKLNGALPDDVFLKGPALSHGLYKKYSLPQVQRVLTPIKSEIISDSTSRVILRKQKFTNNSGIDGKFDIAISHSVTDSTTFTRSTGDYFKVGQQFNYGISFGVETTGETSFEYSKSWGTEEKKTEKTTITSNSTLSVILPPKRSVIAMLSSDQGILNVRVTYNAYLTGTVIANYESPHHGHHFWFYPIKMIMEAAGLDESLQSTEDINVKYHSEGEIILSDNQNNDNESGEIISERLFNIISDIKNTSLVVEDVS